MKYNLIVRSRTDYNLTIEQKHSQFFRRWQQMSPHIGVEVAPTPPLPEIGSQLVTKISLTKYLPNKIKGYICYCYRGNLRDTAMHDDFISLTFNPEKILYKSVVKELFINLVTCFDGYLGFIQNEEAIYRDFEIYRNHDCRHDVWRINLVNYFDYKLCRDAFLLTPEEIYLKLDSKVEYINLVSNGVFIIASSEILSIIESDEIDAKIRNFLSD